MEWGEASVTNLSKSEELWEEVDELAEQAASYLENVRELGSRRLWNPTTVNAGFLDRCAYGLTVVLSRIAEAEENEAK